MDVDVAVLGGGPGGYPAAIRASQLGLSVALIEQGRLGGTCLNVGCIPTKALVQSAHAVKDAHTTFAQLGVKVAGVEIDWPQMQANKQSVVDGSVSGLGGLLKANGVNVVQGRGRFASANVLEVDGSESITFKHAVIATGSQPLRPPIEGIDHPRCIDSTGLLAIDHIPQRLIVIGGGVIGCEFASIFSHLGSEVTIVEFLDHLIAIEDADAVAALERAFKKQKVALHLGARGTRVEETGEGMTLWFEQQGETKSVSGDVILVATGRGAVVDGVGLDAIGVEYTPKAIQTDETRRTSVPNIYAVGDVTDRINLTPVAIREGHAFADTVFGGKPTEVDHADVPTAVFSEPEVGVIGLTETLACERYPRVDVYKTSFRPMKATLSGRDTRSFFKLIVDTASDRVLGCHIVGPDAGEMIQLVGIAVKMNATKADFDAVMAVHPTAAEELVTLRTKAYTVERQAAE